MHSVYLLGILVCLSAGDLAVHGANFLLVHMSRVPVLLGSLYSLSWHSAPDTEMVKA